MRVTCGPPTNCATDARSVSDVATLRFARAGALAALSASATAVVSRDRPFLPTLLRGADAAVGPRPDPRCPRASVRMGRVVADGVAHLEGQSIVGRDDAGVRLRVAVLEPDERELGRDPRDVHRPTGHVPENGRIRVVDHEVGEAPPGTLAAHAHPEDL